MFVTQDFTVCSSGLHRVLSVEIYAILPEGFLLRPSSRWTLSFVGFYLIVKFYKMQARVVHRDHIARGFPQAGLYHTIFPYVAWEICELSFIEGLCKFLLTVELCLIYIWVVST